MPRAAINIPSAQSIRHRAKLRSDDQLGETSGEGAPEQFAQRVGGLLGQLGVVAHRRSAASSGEGRRQQLGGALSGVC
jgi:hypothetical protein